MYTTQSDPIPPPAEYFRYFVLFNNRDFFEAHEVLEDLWVVEVEPLRTYYKGLIQAAVAICHWQRGNHSGARKLHRSAMAYLAPYPEQFEGFALGDFRRTMEELFGPWEANPEAAPPYPESRIPILFVAGVDGGN